MGKKQQNKLRYSVTYEVDKDFLCDEETIKDEFNGSWQEWLDYFITQELGEILLGFDTDPIEIKVEKQL